MNKKSLILLPVAMLFLAGCNNDTTPSSSTSSSETPTPTPSTSTTTSQTVTVNYGSLTAPLSIAEFNTEVAKLGLKNEEFSTKHFFVKGYVFSAPEYTEKYSSYKLKLTDGKDSYSYINVSGAILDSGVETPYHNDTVVVEGLAELYNNNYSIWYSGDDSPVVKTVTRGTSTITTTIENGTITGLNATYTNGTTATFTVTPDSDYSVSQVSAYGTVLTATDGEYSFTVAGDGAVSVVLTKAGEVFSYLAKYDFSSLTGNGTEFSTTTFKEALTSTYVNGSAGNMVSEVTATSKAYNGNGSGGAHENEKGLIKLGTKSDNASFTLKLTGTVSKVTLNYHDFYKSSATYTSTKNTLSINGVSNSNPYTDTGDGVDVVFELTTASDTLEFSASGRAVIFSMIFE